MLLVQSKNIFQKTCRTAAMRGKAELCIYNLKKTSPPQSRSQAVVSVSTPRMYPRSGYFLVSVYYVNETNTGQNPPLCNVKETINPTVHDNILTSPLSRRDF